MAYNNLEEYLVPASYFTQGGLWGWGSNFFGHLGNDTRTHVSSPVQTITSGTNWKLVAAGDYHAGGIKTDGTLWLWGNNLYGQLGDNTANNKSSPVQTVSGGSNWKQLSAGRSYTGAIKTDGTLWLWGRNFYGQVGDNSNVNKSSPVQIVGGGGNWKLIACGRYHCAAIKTDGSLWSWGNNNYGQLGDNTGTRKSSPVQIVGGGSDWKMVACGYEHTAAIKTNGTLWLWGNGTSGQLGNSGTSNMSSPVQTVAAGNTWRTVAANRQSTVAVKTDGTLWMWGRNAEGQLGDNTKVSKSSPVQTVAGGTNWKSVATGNQYRTAAIKSDGTLWLWGANGYGMLGTNNQAGYSSPVQTVAAGTNWKFVSGGFYFTLGINSTWGTIT